MAPQNLLLAALPREVFECLGRHSQTVTLKHGEILHRPNQRIEDVYFPLDCLISVTVTMNEARFSGSSMRRAWSGSRASASG